MKNVSLLTVLLFIAGLLPAQDHVFLITGDTIAGKVLSLDKEILSVALEGTISGHKDIRRGDLVMIQYGNGIIENFRPAMATDGSVATSSDSSYMRGVAEARVYYKNYKTAGTATFLISFLYSPVLGLIPAIASSSSAPKTSNLGIPVSISDQRKPYTVGYTEEARKIKSRKVWKNWGVAAGIYSGIILMSIVNGGIY